MSDDSLRDRLSEAWGRLDPWTVLLVVVIVLSAVSGAFAATTSFVATKDARIVAPTGFTVVFGTKTTPSSGNKVTANNQITIKNVEFESQSGSLTVDVFNKSGEWTNISQASVSSDLATVDRPDTYPVGITGTADGLRVHKIDLSRSTKNTDLVATAGGSWTLVLNNTGLSQGQGVVAVDRDTGKTLDAASVDGDGDVALDELSSVTTARLDIKKGASTFRVFKSAKPSTLVQDATLRIRVFGQNSTFVDERQVKDGKMDLSGVPLDEPLTITVSNDTKGYAYRRTIIRSAQEQSEIYLLNTTNNNDIANVVFELDDRTGRFPPSKTQLYIEKPITKDFDNDNKKETKYQVVAGDVFGASGEFGTVLEAGERYRLVIRNKRGDTRVLGAYTATVNDKAVLRVGQVGIKVPEKRGYVADLRVIRKDANTDGTKEQFVRAVFADSANRTEELRYTIRNVTGNTTVATKTVSGPLGTHVATYKVGQNKSSSSYKFNWSITRESDNGTDVIISGVERAGNVRPIFGEMPLDQRWLSLGGYISIVALAGLVVIKSPRLGGIVATGWATILTVLGAVAIPYAALGLAGAVSFVALIGRTQPP